MSDIDKFVASSESDLVDPHSAVAGQLDSLSQQLSAATKANPKLGAVVADLKSKLPAAKATVKAAAAHYKKMTCIEGTECYDKENLSDLEWKYNHARSVEKRAPRDVITAKKNLYTFKYSKHYWNQMERDKYNQLADTKYKEMVNNRRIKNKELDVLIDSYSNSLTNQQNMDDYISKLKKENKQLDHKIRNKLSTLNTNERKVWYEKHELGYMSNWTQLMFYIYYLFVLVFIYYFIQKKLWKAGGYRNNTVDIVLLVLFVFWGYISLPISGYLFKIIQFLIGLIPIDAYSKL